MNFFAKIRNFFIRHSKLRFLAKFLLLILAIIISSAALTFGGLEAGCRPSAASLPGLQAQSQIPSGNIRPEVSTYLSYPEWFIVYSSDEYAQFLAQNRPSRFPYFGSIHQYWSNYCKVYAITKARHEFNAGDHLMLFVIGWSYSAEYAAKGVYENTIGRLSEIFGKYPATEEDIYAGKVAKNYVDFIRLRPFYEYNFAGAFSHLWTDNNFFGPHFARKLERRIALSLEYGVKTIYCKLIGIGSHSVYGVESVDTYVIANNVSDAIFSSHPEIEKIKALGPKKYLMIIPRYQPFTDLVPRLAKQGVEFLEIAGNREIFMTALVPSNVQYLPPAGQVVFQTNILTNPSKKRIALSVPVEVLSQVLPQLMSSGGIVEHIYDY